MTSKGNESGNRNSEKLKENYETDLTKMKLDSEIEKLLQLRRRFEKDIYRVQRTYLDVDRNAKILYMSMGMQALIHTTHVFFSAEKNEHLN